MSQIAPQTDFFAIVLAAGKGTRMRSDLPKVMHPLAGFPLLWHVLKTLETLTPARVTIVTAPGMETVRELAEATLPGCLSALQEQQLGTGHAVLAAKASHKSDSAAQLILYGDTPLIRAETLECLLRRLEDCDLAVLGMHPADPKEYGRLITGPGESLEAIVEYKDASAEQRRIGLCNSGVMAVANGKLFDLLAEVKNTNAKGEYYLTDIVAIARSRGLTCGVVEAEEAELLGINSRAELAEAEAAIQSRLRLSAMERGATLLDPASVYFAADTVLGEDVTVGPNVFFGPGVTVGSHAEIRPFSHLEGATIGDRCIVGPFARLRPSTKLAEGVHIGNFVEIKNAVLERGAKANHLSYLGDASIGAETNIGAGTITCNFDGYQKHRTEIGSHVFVGSNSSLIAPLSIGDGAIIGAGSTISRDIATGALALTRPEITEKPGAATEFHRKRKTT